MKILIDARLFGPEHAGNGRYTMNLVQELAKVDRENKYTIFLRKKYFQDLKLPKNWEKVLADFKHYSIAEQMKLPFLIKKYNPDITHFPHFNVPLFYFGKYITTVHDMIMHKHKGGEATTLPAPFYQIRRLGYNLSFQKAVGGTKVIVPTNAVKKELVKYYKMESKKVIPIYEGLDSRIKQEKFTTKIPGDYFVYTGSAYPHKNLERLLRAFVEINKTTKVILAISSSRNVFTKRLEKLIQELKAESFVKLLGFVPDEKIGSLYQKSKGFVFPTLSEGFGLPPMEAISSGTISLVSDIPVLKEVYKKSVIYFDPYDIFSIKNALEHVLAMSTSDRKSLMTKSQSFIKKYSWRKMAEETLKVYESLK